MKRLLKFRAVFLTNSPTALATSWMIPDIPAPTSRAPLTISGAFSAAFATLLARGLIQREHEYFSYIFQKKFR